MPHFRFRHTPRGQCSPPAISMIKPYHDTFDDYKRANFVAKYCWRKLSPHIAPRAYIKLIGLPCLAKFISWPARRLRRYWAAPRQRRLRCHAIYKIISRRRGQQYKNTSRWLAASLDYAGERGETFLFFISTPAIRRRAKEAIELRKLMPKRGRHE